MLSHVISGIFMFSQLFSPFTLSLSLSRFLIFSKHGISLLLSLSMSHVTVRQWMRHTTFPRYSMQEKQSFGESTLSLSAMSNHTDLAQRSLRGITYMENILSATLILPTPRDPSVTKKIIISFSLPQLQPQVNCTIVGDESLSHLKLVSKEQFLEL